MDRNTKAVAREAIMSVTLTVLHPGVEGEDFVHTQPRLAARLATLQGKRIALLDNGKVNADKVLAALASRLQRLGAGEARVWKKQHAGQTGAPQIKELLRGMPDLVLTALGD
jgi:hypothetical protein